MLNKIKIALISLAGLFMFAMPAAMPAVAHAADIQNSVCSGAVDLNLSNTSQCSDTQTGTKSFNSIIKTIINVFSVVVGIVAVIMIIVGGFRYITSGGQAEKITAAKNTILYALVGLIIVALAQIIVKFVLNKATQ